jgi:hypothetical protein
MVVALASQVHDILLAGRWTRAKPRILPPVASGQESPLDPNFPKGVKESRSPSNRESRGPEIPKEGVPRVIDDDYYAMDAAISDYNDQIALEAIKDFKYESLQKYLLATSALLQKSKNMAEEASRFLHQSATGCHLMASISCEISVKRLLLEPMVHGLISQSYAASLVSELVIGRNPVDRFSRLFLRLLAEEGGIDLLTFRRGGNTNTNPLWEELKLIFRRRNEIAHGAEMVSRNEARHALEVAEVLLNKIFPEVLDKFYLGILKGEIRYKSEIIRLSKD